MATQAENKIMKRNKILESAYNLFMSKSVTATAVDDVVKMAGVAKGTFYLYFKDKYDLLEQIVIYKSAGVIREGLEALREKIETEDISFTDRVLFLTDYVAEFLHNNRELTALLNKNLSSCFKYASSGENDEYTEILKIFMNGFIEEGYSEKDAAMTIYLITDMTGSVCCDAVLGTGPFTFEDIYPQLRAAIKNILEAKNK